MGWFRSTPPGGDDDPPSLEARLEQIGPGIPGRCPACDGMGYIDSLDIGHRYQIQHCKDCLHRWEYLFDADGTVVGLTELDEAGRPVERSRVRPLRAPTPAELPSSPTPPPPTAGEPDGGGDDEDVVLDLRDAPPAEAPEVERTDPKHLSPAEWLRRPLHR